jgi:hypothetical protein
MVTRTLCAAALVFTVGCQPDFPDRSSAVTDTRILAVRSDPAEAKPGAAVSFKALVVSPNGVMADAKIDWAFCSLQHAISDENDIASSCFVLKSDYLVSLGAAAPTAKGKLPANGCRQFGPDLPEALPGQPPGRPTDPDPTGGYYQPVRLILPDGAGFVLGAGTTRLECGLPGATVDALVAFKKSYRANENPTFASVVALGSPPRPLTEDDGKTKPLVVGRGEVLHLEAAWPACPAVGAAVCGDMICDASEDAMGCPADCKTAPKGCTGAENYIAFDLTTRDVAQRHEAVSVAWAATGGSFTSDTTGRDENEMANTADNDWTAPSTPGDVLLWTVIHDNRGGVDWRTYRVTVQ